MPSGSGIDTKLEQLSKLFSAGRHAELERLAQEILDGAPQDGRAWKALGIAQLVQGKAAAAALHRALEFLPQDVDVMAALGSAQAAAGDLVGAMASYQAALNLQPTQAHLHVNLADLMLRQGKPQQAERMARHALSLSPAQPAAWLNLGRALLAQDRPEHAVDCFGRCLQLQVHHPLATSLLAQALRDSGRPSDAVPLLQQAARNAPQAIEPQFQLGLLLRGVGRLEEAAQAFSRVLALSPLHVEALTNRAVCQLELGDGAAALEALLQAVDLQPGDALIHANLGNARLGCGQFDAAIAAHHEAVALAPGEARFRRNLAHALRAAGDASAALAQLRMALQSEPEDLALKSEALFVSLYLAHDTHAQRAVCAEALDFAASVAKAVQGGVFEHWANLAQPERPLRVGLVSADLRAHPISYLLELILRAWADDSAAPVQVVAYANQRAGDSTSDRLRALCAGWRNVADLSDQALCELIRADGVDVLLDVSGHTLGNRLPMFARRPAPVQVAWLGFSTTTGLNCFDAVLADPFLAPPGDEGCFVEPVLRLPQTAFCMAWPTAGSAQSALPNEHPHNMPPPPGSTRFGCFNHLAKMGPEVIAVWARILQSVPGSSLSLQAAPFQDPAVEHRVRLAFAAHAVEPDRLRLLPSTSREAYLQAYGEIDIALDPFPYPGGATSLEALWMGVPVLTMTGATPLSRQGVSFLMNLGLPEWVAQDKEDYVARAVRMAANPLLLAQLKGELRQRMAASPLCNGGLMARSVHDALRQLWRQWCSSVGAAIPRSAD